MNLDEEPPSPEARVAATTAAPPFVSRLRVGTPRVEAPDTKWFEGSGVAGDNGHVGDLRDRCDESVVQRRRFGNSVGGHDPRSRQIQWQHPFREGRQHTLLEPAAQNRALVGVGSFHGDDSTLELADGEGGDELVGDRHRRSRWAWSAHNGSPKVTVRKSAGASMPGSMRKVADPMTWALSQHSATLQALPARSGLTGVVRVTTISSRVAPSTLRSAGHA